MAHHTDGMLLLVPADPLRPRRPDEHFAAEAAAAKDAGLDVALIDHDALADPGRAERAVARVPNAGGTAICRGWMLRADQYAALAEALKTRDVTLWTSAAQYQRAHELPGWHAALSPVTPQAEWTNGDGEQDFKLACARLGQGPAVLRERGSWQFRATWVAGARASELGTSSPGLCPVRARRRSGGLKLNAQPGSRRQPTAQAARPMLGAVGGLTAVISARPLARCR